jgi:hypothetical protein
MTPDEFVRRYSEESPKISRVEVVPPRLGEPGFGKLRVIYRDRVYAGAHGWRPRQR